MAVKDYKKVKKPVSFQIKAYRLLLKTFCRIA